MCNKSRVASLLNENKETLCLLFEIKFVYKFIHINIFPEWPIIYYFFVSLQKTMIIIISMELLQYDIL